MSEPRLHYPTGRVGAHMTQREVTGIRPLAIGAAYSDSFEFLCPPSWNMATVRYELWKALPMTETDWSKGKLQKLGEGHWRAVRGS